jgi:hypothetical protein
MVVVLVSSKGTSVGITDQHSLYRGIGWDGMDWIGLDFPVSVCLSLCAFSALVTICYQLDLTVILSILTVCPTDHQPSQRPTNQPIHRKQAPPLKLIHPKV